MTETKLRPLSPKFMAADELTAWNNLSSEEKEKHLLEVKEYNKESVGDCVQCQSKNLAIINYLDHKLCVDCFKYQMETAKSGVATCARYTNNKEINCYDYQARKCCGECSLCLERKKLTGISTLVLMTELYWGRKDFNALITWEDDGFIIRFQELMWELNEVKGKAPEEIEKLVGESLSQKISQRKFSRGT